MTTVYYGGTERLDEMISRDGCTWPWEIIKEAERLVRLEFAAAQSYREKPELLSNSHPWMTFVRHPDCPLAHGYIEDWEALMNLPKPPPPRSHTVIGEQGCEIILRSAAGSVLLRETT